MRENLSVLGGKCHRRKAETDLGQAPFSTNEASTPGEEF